LTNSARVIYYKLKKEIQMKHLKDSLNFCFNWKKHPTSAIFIAAPLFLLGMIFAAGLSVLHIKESNDWSYAIIFGIFLVPATLCLVMMIESLKDCKLDDLCPVCGYRCKEWKEHKKKLKEENNINED